MKGVVTKENDTIDRTKKISWEYSIVGAIIMILDLAILSVRLWWNIQWKCLYSGGDFDRAIEIE